MSVVAVYHMKGGVGKTTTAVNLSYLAAASGQRTLLWDLDPQAASSFAFRVRPRVRGFGKKSLASGQALAAAVKETDYNNLDLLPADFAYRKLDRFLGDFGKPERVVTDLIEMLSRDYDVVFLDCPGGFSLLT
jgi:cellulose biosynthesis protein BcsQ